MLRLKFLLGIVNGLGTFALLTLLYGATLRRQAPGWAGSLTLGILFGIGAALSIANAVELAPGLRIDPRAVVLVLAAPFGGTAAGVLAALITTAVRLAIAGTGALPGVANIVATASIGIAFHHWIGRKSGVVRDRHLLLLGLLSNVPLLFILAVPVENAADLFLGTIGPMTIADTLGVLLLGRFLNNVRAFLHSAQTLETEANSDPLTGLSNRRGMERQADRIIASARDSGEPISLLVIDIDRFKAINDRYGHDVGDIVLKEVAEVVRATVRKSDAIARFGGEEIVVLLPALAADPASRMAERIRRAVQQQVGRGEPHEVTVTVSVGVATRAGWSLSFTDLFRSADQALYRAKRSGRNQVATQSAGPAEVSPVGG